MNECISAGAGTLAASGPCLLELRELYGDAMLALMLVAFMVVVGFFLLEGTDTELGKRMRMREERRLKEQWKHR